MDLIFLLVHFFVFLINYLIWNRRVFQPAVLFSLTWLAVLLMQFVFRFTVLDELRPLSLELHLLFLAGTIIFSVGGLLIYLNCKKNESKNVYALAQGEISVILQTVLTILILIGLPFYISASYQIFIASQAEEFFKGLRNELTAGDADIGPSKYFMSLAYVVYAVNLYAYYKQKSKLNMVLLIVSFLLLLIYAVFGTGRTYFLIIFSIYLGVGFFSNPNFSVKKYAGAFGIFIMTFVLIGIIYGKGGSAFFSIKENINAAVENLGIYVVTPLNALDVEIKDNTVIKTEGDNTLRFFKKIGMQLGVLPNKKVADLIQVYVYVPYATNVYTYYSPYIKDFGIAYSLFMLFVFGLLHAWVYNKAVKTGAVRYIFYCSFLFFPLFLSFFSDEYLTLMSFWIQVAVFIEVILFINSIVFLKKRDAVNMRST